MSKNISKIRSGSALTETVLLTATSIVLIVSIFYPQIVGLTKNVLDVMSAWFENATSIIGAT